MGVHKEWADTKKRALKEGKRDLKTDYVIHCQEMGNTCVDHCCNFALNDLLDKDLQKKFSHSHVSLCTSRENLKETLEDIKKAITSFSTNLFGKEQQEGLLYEYSKMYYTNAFDLCAHDWYAVVSILEHLVNENKKRILR